MKRGGGAIAPAVLAKKKAPGRDILIDEPDAGVQAPHRCSAPLPAISNSGPGGLTGRAQLTAPWSGSGKALTIELNSELLNYHGRSGGYRNVDYRPRPQTVGKGKVAGVLDHDAVHRPIWLAEGYGMR